MNNLQRATQTYRQAKQNMGAANKRHVSPAIRTHIFVTHNRARAALAREIERTEELLGRRG